MQGREFLESRQLGQIPDPASVNCVNGELDDVLGLLHTFFQLTLTRALEG